MAMTSTCRQPPPRVVRQSNDDTAPAPPRRYCGAQVLAWVVSRSANTTMLSR